MNNYIIFRKDLKLNKNKKIGNIGERLAKVYLLVNGYQILKCNYRIKIGEIDIIAKKNNIIHFVEVKTRTNKRIEARESIGKTKCDHILRVAKYYLSKNKIYDIGCQVDAIEVYLQKGSIEIDHIEQIIAY